MKFLLSSAMAIALLGGAAQASGDAAKGEAIFAKNCKTCHAIVDKDGKDIVKGGKTGPNQYGLIGGPAAHDEGFARYGASLKALRETGFTWTEDEVAEYIADPRKYLQEKLGDKKAKSNMAYKVKDEQARKDVAAYLAQFAH